MKKAKPFLIFSLFVLLLELLGIFLLSTREIWAENAVPLLRMTLVLFGFWFCGIFYLLLRRGNPHKALSRLIGVCGGVLLGICVILGGIFLLTARHGLNSSFSVTTPLFSHKNVMIVVPHQDDDINLMGGLIEQYTAAGSDVTVVFATNGDCFADPGIRADEVLKVLTELGVKQENICYLGFGDQWMAQDFGGNEISHIYHSPDPDRVWTSRHGSTATYGTSSIPCYLQLPYTRRNYVYSFESLLLEKQPDTIFAVDFDPHIDHKATGAFFEEALCNVLTSNPNYHPRVYKGFCYATAWEAPGDYFNSMNLHATLLPQASVWAETAFGYKWEDRDRFPISETNLNRVLFHNSVYRSLQLYRSQGAALRAKRILNGDKVFWQRRTDSLLYGAEIFVDGAPTTLLNDFKLKDFSVTPDGSTVIDPALPLQSSTVSVVLSESTTVNSICLYDDPDPLANILSGCIRFSDGSKLDFGPLEANGSATTLSFPEKQVEHMEIVITAWEGQQAGLSEIEAYYETDAPQQEAYLMAVDADDHFVYDYLLHGDASVSFDLCRFPEKQALSEGDVTVTLVSENNSASCRWEQGRLTVTCPQGDACTVTLSSGTLRTTFSVSNPAAAEYAYLRAIRFAERCAYNIPVLFTTAKEHLSYLLHTYIL